MIRFRLHQQMIQKLKFMEHVDRLKAIRLYATTLIYVGSPTYLDDRHATEYNTHIGRNYFQNILMISRARRERKLVTFANLAEVTSHRWQSMPVFVGAVSLAIYSGAPHLKLMNWS